MNRRSWLGRLTAGFAALFVAPEVSVAESWLPEWFLRDGGWISCERHPLGDVITTHFYGRDVYPLIPVVQYHPQIGYIGHQRDGGHFDAQVIGSDFDLAVRWLKDRML